MSDTKSKLYVEMRFDENTNRKLEKLQSTISNYLGFMNHTLIPIEDFHTTVMYSTEMAPYVLKDVNGIKLEVTLEPKIWSVKGGEENIVVLEFENSFIENRHHYGRHIGCKHTFKRYRPHITIIENLTDVDKQDFIDLLKYDLSLVLEKERKCIDDIFIEYGDE